MDIRTQRLNEAFNASGLSQMELCKRTGITKGAISSYLSGRYFPKQKTIEVLAKALNVSIPYLMGYEETTVDENGVVVDYTVDEGIIIEKVRRLSPAKRALLESVLDQFLEGETK